MKAKSELKYKVVDLFKKLKTLQHVVAFIRCDDAGENRSLEAMCKQEGLGIKFEYSGPKTPQRNGRVERKFQTLYSRVRSMMNGAGLKPRMKLELEFGLSVLPQLLIIPTAW